MDPEFVAAPYPTHAHLRAEDLVHQSPLRFWVLTRYEDVAAVLRDPTFARQAIAVFAAARFGVTVRRADDNGPRGQDEAPGGRR
jgi:cytochrome P450